MGSARNHRRAGTGIVLAGFAFGLVVGLTGCGGGDGDSSSLPTPRSERSIDRPASEEPDGAPTSAARPTRTDSAQATRSQEPDRTTAKTETTTRPPTSTTATQPEPTQTTTRTTAPAETTTRPPASTAVAAPAPTTRTTLPATTATPAASASAAATAKTEGVSPIGWLVVIALIAAMIIGGLLVYRSQRRSAWDAEARELEAETRSITGTRLPPVLSTSTAGQRSLVWPPVRAGLVDLMNRWSALAERASGDRRRNWSLQLNALLQDLVTAVDAENEALALGDDWTLLRPRVRQAEQALAAVLAVPAEPEPPAAGEPGPRAYQT